MPPSPFSFPHSSCFLSYRRRCENSLLTLTPFFPLHRFHDHQMITSRKDILGTELLSLPFRRDELEAILEDLA